MKHPELVRSVVLAEPPLLRWLPKLPGGQHFYDDFMNNMWDPTGREFRRGNAEQALRITIDWFGRNGYLIEGKPAQFDALPADVRSFILQNSLEWQALTTSSDAFPMLDRAAVKAIKVPILLMSGQNTMQLNKLINAELHRLLPNAETVVIQGATHEMWAEKPDVCRARVASFIAKH
jgi:pimeloyl-ACP methyl ester carboxylesterase